jgi:hypothetical protein
MYRPDVAALAAEFKGMTLVRGEEVVAGRLHHYESRNLARYLGRALTKPSYEGRLRRAVQGVQRVRATCVVLRKDDTDLR